MKALTVAQPWASLIVAGTKTIETRPSPPNGPMRPDGVRGLPGLAIERGERIAIHAGARHDNGFFPVKYVDLLPNPPTTRETWRLPGGHEIPRDQLQAPIPYGAIVGTVVVADALPIASEDVKAELPCIEVGDRHLSLWYPPSGAPGDEAAEHYATDQLPLGDYRPGRWGWLLADPKLTTEQCPSDCARFDGQWPGWMLGSGWDWVPCPVCAGAKRCDPVPVRGRQGVWEWTP